MLLSLDWLKEYVDFDIDPEELAERLSLTGTEVDSVERIDEPQYQDAVLELEITPNRPDCMGMIGLAREVAAFSGKKVKKSMRRPQEINVPISQGVNVRVTAPDLCPRYAARVVRNVKVTESPEWMQRRLQLAGVRPINNAVDVTNYVMLETGQPLHAFDQDRLVGDTVWVRRAEPRERITTLDGDDRELDEEMLVIADDQGPVALAGVMGGANSEVSRDTKTVLLESANFLATGVLRTSRRLGLISESSLRFERGVDIGGADWALDRAAQLLQELAGGEVLKGTADVFPNPPKPRQIFLRASRVNKVLGTGLTAEEIGEPLQRLGMSVSLRSEAKATASDPELVVEAPTFRVDLEREIDLVEEVARLYGYDRIEATLPAARRRQGFLTAQQRTEALTKDLLTAAGLWETVSYSFLDPGELDALGYARGSRERRFVEIKNPITSEQSKMRTTLIPGLIRTIKCNVARGMVGLRIFEMGRVFHPRPGQRLPDERLLVAGALTGQNARALGRAEGPLDFYDAKGVVEILVARLGIEDVFFKRTSEMPYHPGRCSQVLVGEDVVGTVGELHPEIQQTLELPHRVALFQLAVADLITRVPASRTFEEPSRYPAVSLDLALVVDENVASAEVEKIIRQKAGDLLEKLVLFDVYTGSPIPEGKKSLAYALTFRASNRTLDWAEVEAQRDQVVAELESELGAGLRV